MVSPGELTGTESGPTPILFGGVGSAPSGSARISQNRVDCHEVDDGYESCGHGVAETGEERSGIVCHNMTYWRNLPLTKTP